MLSTFTHVAFSECKGRSNMTALGEVLGLLAAGGEPASEGESYLASSILHSGQPPDNEVGGCMHALSQAASSCMQMMLTTPPAQAKKLVEVLSSRAGEGDLGLLVEVITACSSLTLAQNFTNWSQVLMRKLQVRR